MTSEPEFPLLRGRVLRSDPFINPSNPHTERELPERNPAEHRRVLLEFLDTLAEEAAARAASRVPQATREIIAIDPMPEYELAEKPLGDKRSDVRVVSVDETTGTAIIDAPSPELPALRRKLDEYADDRKVTKTGARRNEPALGPVESIRLAGPAHLASSRLRHVNISESDRRWFELSCRGGTRFGGDTETSREQVRVALGSEYFATHQLQEFETAERVHFYVHLSLQDLRHLVEKTDCIYEFDIVEPQVRRWLYLENQSAVDVRGFVLTPPPEGAPVVAVLDTGVASEHPLLAPAIRASVVAAPGEPSAADSHGHGTNMVGLAIYGDSLSDALDDQSYTAPHWIESGRVLVTPERGGAAASERPYWPATTHLAIERVEEENPDANRVFCMAVGALNDFAGAPTGWSVAIDELAFDRRRLIFLAIGNVDHDRDSVEDYPRFHLGAPLVDPAQSINAITVGAYTTWGELLPPSAHGEYAAVAKPGQVSPHSRSGIVGDVVKPDVVFEGGNLFWDGQIPTIGDTASYLTTGREVLQRPLWMLAGTSPATAVAARFAAQVWATNPELAPETIRALVIHSATWTDEMTTQFAGIEERLALCGWGVPDLPFAERCAANRATVIYEGAMASKDDAGGSKRTAHIFRLPLPDSLKDTWEDAEVRVTLSYFPEPRRRRDRVNYGLQLRWDMQGPAESEELFLQRVNRASRPNHARRRERDSKSFNWTLGRQRRSRGSVQSDRWVGPAAHLASSKLIAVYPVLGWWDGHNDLEEEHMPYSLVVTVRTATGVNIYESVKAELSVDVDVA